VSTSQSALTDRAALVAALDRIHQQLSGQATLFGAAVAEKVGIHPTDLEALGLLLDEGPMTAGRLADRTGLTTGAVTRMIDRLERDGYVQRQPDPGDRRRVIVAMQSERVADIVQYYEPMQSAGHDLYDQFSDEQLTLIHDYLLRAYEIGLEQTRRLREGAGE
jgi:DNA-binding MarR family transcriptional regulator